MQASQQQSLADKMAVEKQISIRQIVEDEKKLLKDRYEREIQELKARHDVHVQALTAEDGGVRNKNEKLQKTVVAKEGEVVQQGHVIADLEA